MMMKVTMITTHLTFRHLYPHQLTYMSFQQFVLQPFNFSRMETPSTPTTSSNLKFKMKRSRQMVDRDTKGSTIGPVKDSTPSGKKPRKSRKKLPESGTTTPSSTPEPTPSTPTAEAPTTSPSPPVSKTPSERISAKSLRARQKLKDSPLSKLRSAEPAPTSDEVNEDLKREWLSPFGGIEMWVISETDEKNQWKTFGDGLGEFTTQTLAEPPNFISLAFNDVCGTCGDPDCWRGVFEG